MKRPLIVGVMGGGKASPEDADAAYRLGQLIANQGWVLLNGGRSAGIMEASAKGAQEQGGLTVGILPDDNYDMASAYVTIPVLTGMGSARNSINVLSSHVVVACPGGSGTISEIALGLKNNRPVILMNFDIGKIFENYRKQGVLHYEKTPEDVIEKIKKLRQIKE
ncbi:TIGR00725 family protein [Desulfonema magnum]|uniref:TIGR00725 family protein n=1 Tax=Desulfonema magnum TaxID=45655 RepID=A0A975BHD7_9BACT|nr:TIGR00725 family protein [Desulfonema magnum]QTA85075.1 TIGR00725 family protein [Desulfonema magnum]